MPAHAVGILLLFAVVRVGTGLTLMMNIVYGRRWGVGGNKKSSEPWVWNFLWELVAGIRLELMTSGL